MPNKRMKFASFCVFPFRKQFIFLGKIHADPDSQRLFVPEDF